MPTTTANPIPKLTVAVVLYHSELGALRDTLAHLGACVAFIGEPVPLTVVDQSCDHAYSQRAQALCQRITADTPLILRYLVPGQNPGYGGGHNAAMRAGLGRLHLILNPDVELQAEALERAFTTLSQHPDVVMLGPWGLSERGGQEYLAKGHPSVLVLALRAFAPRWLQKRFASRMDAYELRHLPDSGVPQTVPLLSGCCMLVRGEALQAVGGFDEDFFLYFEDYDLSKRLARLGQVVQDPTVRVIHHGGNAARKGWRHIGWFVAGAARFFNRWGWRWF